jgi:hypothetical protein
MSATASDYVGQAAVPTTPISKGRIALAGLVVFLLTQVAAVIVHGFLLASDYEPFEGTLLRANADGVPDWQFIFLPVRHLSFTIGFVWLFCVARVDRDTGIGRALKLGVMAYLMGPAPMFLLWFAQQPWPGTLTVKQLGYELVITLVLAVIAGAVLQPRPTASRTAGSPRR